MTPVMVISVPVLGNNDELVGFWPGMFRLGESRVSALYASIVRLRLAGERQHIHRRRRQGGIIYDSGYQRTGQTVDLAAMRGRCHGGTIPSRAWTWMVTGSIASYAPVPGTNWTL